MRWRLIRMCARIDKIRNEAPPRGIERSEHLFLPADRGQRPSTQPKDKIVITQASPGG